MRGKALTNRRYMTEEEIEAIKSKLLKYFAEGLSIDEVSAKAGMSPEALIQWARTDLMLGHHLITAQAQFEAGLRLKKGDNTVIQAKIMKKVMKEGKGKKVVLVWTGEWEWTGKWEDKYHLDTFAHAKQKLYYLSTQREGYDPALGGYGDERG